LLTLVILVTWEVEIGGPRFETSLKKKKKKKLVRLYHQKQGRHVGWCKSVLPATWEAKVRGFQSKTGLGKNVLFLQ
jgi:hypothetical protein